MLHLLDIFISSCIKNLRRNVLDNLEAYAKEKKEGEKES